MPDCVDGSVPDRHGVFDLTYETALVQAIRQRDVFVTPCACLNASIMGRAPTAFAADARVSSRLDAAWQATLEGSFNTFPQGGFGAVLRTVKALRL